MNPYFQTLILLLAAAQLVLPYRYAFAPLLIAAFHLGNGEFIGELTPPRMLIILGLARAVIIGKFRWSISNPIDALFAFFAVAALVTAAAHDTEYNYFLSNVGLIINVCGTYLYGRAYLQGDEWMVRLAEVTAWSVIPLGIMILAENITATNYYSVIGVSGEGVMERDGTLRARGSFRHPILGGTAGAVCLPLCLVLWRDRRRLALAGAVAAAVVAVGTGSSGPMAAALAACGFLWFWRKRNHMPKTKWAVVGAIAFLSVYMERPFYYIMDSVDLAGGSTGWHRARLIEKALHHLPEWWLAGTDHTRHWMPTGVTWNPDHTDITNYYIHLGVIGGLPLMLTLIAIIAIGFRRLLGYIGAELGDDEPHEFLVWCVGASLFAHALSFIAVSYFDQMYVIFYLLMGGVGGLRHDSLVLEEGSEGEYQVEWEEQVPGYHRSEHEIY